MKPLTEFSVLTRRFASLSQLVLAAIFLYAAWVVPSLAAEVVETDICIYGGTSGGAIAAVQAARMGKTAVVVEFGRHLGGMTSGGLGWTDTGNAATIGGLSREFYRRVGKHYGQGESFTFEPHVAEDVFRSMLEEVKVPVYYQQRLALVSKQGERIMEITMENGNVFRAKMFIDASYEGDLMAQANVSSTYGRESNSVYNETLNGVRGNTPSHQFATNVNVDPYGTPGDPTSGLLPHIQSGDGGVGGSGDLSIQAYNFRLCLTKTETNRIPITAPTNYDAGDYELLGRYVQARVTAETNLSLNSFLKIDPMPNNKTDINNNGAFSTDFIGRNYAYPAGSYATREAIWNSTINYINGLLYFLGTDSRVPSNIRTEMLSWGLCRDEFADTGGWPHQMYVREARRMVSDYVVTEHDCRGTVRTTNPVGLASYTMDSHNCQRVVQNGFVRNEGDFQVRMPGPFPIAYGALVPPRSQCTNLFVTFAVSATHVAFSSVRMEPVFMILSQSAATAASFAIDEQLAVQDVPYYKLRLQMIADRQILDWNSTPSPIDGTVVDNEHTNGITVSGAWTVSSASAGSHGSNYLHDGNSGKGQKSVRFTPVLPEPGVYTVYLWWTENPNRASNAPVTISHANGVTNRTVNQQQNGGTWNALGTFSFETNGPTYLILGNSNSSGYVIADAVMWSPVTAAPFPSVDVIAGDKSASEEGLDTATFSIVRSGDTSGALNVSYALSGTATPGSDFVAPPATVIIPAGQVTATITITPRADEVTEGDETVELTLRTNAGYQLGPYTNAIIELHDGGFGRWRGSWFTPEEILNGSISGESADPDGDGLLNLLEFFHGTEPKNSDTAPGLRLAQENDGWYVGWQRHEEAAGLYLRLEHSTNLLHWSPAPFTAQVPEVTNTVPYQQLRFPIASPTTNDGQRFYRIAVSQTPLALATETANFFFSFDTLTNGQGLFTDTVTANSGFLGIPLVTRTATMIDGAGGGGATLFTDFTGTSWIGSGGASVPGHSLTFNPGSTDNHLSLVFSTIGLRDIRVRMDLRSATQPGGSPPTGFTGFTYDLGAGPVSVPGATFSFVADNTFREWASDLSEVAELEDQPSVTLAWTIEELAATPPESVRIDNIQVTAEPITP